MRRNNNRKNQEPVRVRGTKVEVKNGNVDSAIKKFKKRVDEDGKLKKYAEKRYYEKPSEQRKRKQKKAIARQRKERQKEQERMKRFYDS